MSSGGPLCSRYRFPSHVFVEMPFGTCRSCLLNRIPNTRRCLWQAVPRAYLPSSEFQLRPRRSCCYKKELHRFLSRTESFQANTNPLHYCCSDSRAASCAPGRRQNRRHRS